MILSDFCHFDKIFPEVTVADRDHREARVVHARQNDHARRARAVAIAVEIATGRTGAAMIVAVALVAVVAIVVAAAVIVARVNAHHAARIAARAVVSDAAVGVMMMKRLK